MPYLGELPPVDYQAEVLKRRPDDWGAKRRLNGGQLRSDLTMRAYV